MTLCIFAVLLVVAPVKAAQAQVQVLSVVGRATADGKPLQAGDRFDLSEKKIQLEARPGAVVQALMNGKMALTLVGQGSVVISAKPSEVHVKDRGAVRLAGTGGALVTRGCRFQLRPEGGSMLAEGDRVFALAGQVQFRLTRSAPKGREEPEFSAPATSGTLKAGQVAQVPATADGKKITAIEAKPAPDLLRKTMLFQPPGPWDPEVSRVDLGQVKRAQGLRREQQEQEREMATCGCTEGGGPQGMENPTANESTVVERRGATVRVRVRGMPKKVR